MPSALTLLLSGTALAGLSIYLGVTASKSKKTGGAACAPCASATTLVAIGSGFLALCIFIWALVAMKSPTSAIARNMMASLPKAHSPHAAPVATVRIPEGVYPGVSGAQRAVRFR